MKADPTRARRSKSGAAASSVPTPLRRRWWLVACLSVGATGTVAFLVARAFGASAAGRWLLSSAPVLAYLLWFFRRSLGRNHPPDATDGSPRRTLGVANAVTLGRGWLYAGVAGFLFVVPPVDSAWRWLPVAWYGGGVALDCVDGAVARTVGQRTELGVKLDMAFDTVGFLVAPLVAVAWGRLPVWYLSLSAARYLFKAGRGWRRRRGRPVYDLPPSRVRRPLAGVQMAFITFALLPVVPAAVIRPAAAVVVTPSLAVFVRDYLVVSGHLGSDDRSSTER